MRIIKAVLPEEIKHECDTCSSIFAWDLRDIKYEIPTPFNGHTTYSRVICPVCNSKCYIRVKKFS